jgi:hypothetical protein
MPNLIPQDIREWMRRMEFKVNDLTRRMSNLIPGDIADNVDLDGFMSSGRWRRKSNVDTTTALNYPFDGAAGMLEVYWVPDNVSVQVQQVFHDRSGSRHSRWFNGATWSNWDGVWVDITDFEAGVTPQTGGNTPQVMRQGNIVSIRGRATTAGISGAVTFATLPSGHSFEPEGIFELGHGTTSGSSTSRYFVTTGGSLQAQAWVSGTLLALSGTYGVGQ